MNENSGKIADWLRRPEVLLFAMAAAVPISFATWRTLLNNFAVERANFDGAEMGILQSIREIPGFMAFAVVFILLFLKEQRLAYLSLIALGIGTALTGFYPSAVGLYFTTVIMSIGFHYYETVQTSLALQWIDKEKAPETLGRIVAVGSAVSLGMYGLIWVGTELLALDYVWLYLITGGGSALLAVFCWFFYPIYPERVAQNKSLVLRKRYWLYYALTFMSGARRQIFIVFAAFMMVEKFEYTVSAVAGLYLINALINIKLAPMIGRFIARWGEQKALICEYIGLILVFTTYAFVEDPFWAAVIYVVDHLFFAMAIAIKTYFQKIADPADIASTAGVAFTINHIAAVFLPAGLGIVWLTAPEMVFLIGAGMACISLVLSFNVPSRPVPGGEVRLGHRGAKKQSASTEVPAE
ncbi:MFS transporter [Kiloniella sp. b19]|uniref:MFS transporter n=1 Tax=Kiloniella sp. GXU_MW_B19 TaxID=3141326 RepID=UPI0031DBB200